ncbi:hypothetical protein [Sphingobacterium sp. SYP-B4668]|uniref:hypothetical protein n=1 Tax=Sphingobacterium sp. SYP-B4668 TaxID=2996035 RepID=UPI0022DE431C|nr:hypothetical protein [Sphingobacterium sp. SYP-B4668]
MDLEELLKNQAGDDGQLEKDSPLKSLKKDLDFYAESIKEVSAEMVAEGYTLFPIFIAHQHEVSVGEVMLDKKELGTSWTVNASSLEEFVDRGLIKDDRKAYFERTYKKSEDYMCLFVVVPEGANFVFYPYK